MKSARSKARTAPAIDLPAADVREVATENPGPAPEPVEREDAPPRPGEPPETASTLNASPRNDSTRAPVGPMLVPALIGLVAGALGGFAAYQMSELSLSGSAPGGTPVVDKVLTARLDALEQRLATIRPGEGAAAIPQALADRLTKAETLLAQTTRREAAMREELGKLATNLANETSERRKAIESLPARADTGTNAPVIADLDRLKSRLDSVENEARALSGRLAGLATRDSLGAANAHLAAVNLLDDAFARGAPLSGPLALLKNLGADSGLLARFAPFATSGVPNAKTLLEQLRALKPTPAAAPAEPGKSQLERKGLLERMKNSALSLVEIRRTGDITGTDDAAHLARAEQALGRGEIGPALALVSRLSPAAAPHYADWRSRAEALLKAGEARLALRGNAYAALAKAAATTK